MRGPRTPGRASWDEAGKSRAAGGWITVDLTEELPEIAHGGVLPQDCSADVAEAKSRLFLGRRVFADPAIGDRELSRYDSEAIRVSGRVGGRYGSDPDTGE